MIIANSSTMNSLRMFNSNTKKINLKFNYLTDHLDDFFGPYLADEKEYVSLWYVSKIVVILSHGQSSIERGFTINKEILDNNLQEKSLISRLIHDHFASKNIVLHEYKIPQALKKSCKLANGRYKLALEDSKKENAETEKSRKRKLKLEEIANVKESKLPVQETIESLNKGIEKYLAETEEKRDFTLLLKANVFRNSLKDATNVNRLN